MTNYKAQLAAQQQQQINVADLASSPPSDIEILNNRIRLLERNIEKLADGINYIQEFLKKAYPGE